MYNFSIAFIGCETHPDINLTAHKYQIKLFVPEADGMSEVHIRFDVVSS